MIELVKYYTRMSALSQEMKAELEAAAALLGKAPSTIGREAGQGGRFYARMCAGKRCWPETADRVRAHIRDATLEATIKSRIDEFVFKLGEKR